MEKVRILLRVSSNQQLEEDGDLSVQRQIVLEYIAKHKDWVLDQKEYFEGSNSGYKHTVSERDTLQEALADAQNGEYTILVAYKDDRVGRRMWEIGAYVMTLKSYGVDIYTVKDGCISPESDDIMGQIMLALRYGNAQKSSSDTGMRVKDTAQKLVQKGKFMGGSAPYGYRLVLSGEISKHGRALHKLEIVSEQAEVVKYIYNLSLYQEYGSVKIAKILNEDNYYKTVAPNDVWKSGTIASILTNPVYSGFVAYKRRERINGVYHRLDNKEWIKAYKPDESIRIIDDSIWNKVQDKRGERSNKYRKTQNIKKNTIQKKNNFLPLINVIYCGYCGTKLTNGTKYAYWTIKSTGERRARKIPAYRCQSSQMGIPHNKMAVCRADKIEGIVMDYLAEYIEHILMDEDISEQIEQHQIYKKKEQEAEIKKLDKEINKITQGIEVMEGYIPEAMSGNYSLSIEELIKTIRKYEKKKLVLQKAREDKEEHIKERVDIKYENGWNYKIPTWKQIFRKASIATQRALVDKLIEKIEVTKKRIIIQFKIDIDGFNYE